MTVVELDGIVGLAQWTDLAVRIDIIALLYVLQDIIEIGRHALGFQLVKTALGTYLGRCSYKNLQLDRKSVV